MADVVLVGRVNILLAEARIFQVRVVVPEGVPQEVQVLDAIPRQQVVESSYEEFLELLYQSLDQWYGNFSWEGVQAMWFAMPHFWEPIRHHVHLVAVHPIDIGDLFQQLIALGIPQQNFAQNNLPQQHVAQNLEAGDAEEEEDDNIEAAAEEHLEEHDEEGVDAEDDDAEEEEEEEEDDIYVVEAAAEEHVVEDVDDVEEHGGEEADQDDDDDAEEHDNEDDAAVELDHDGEEGEEESEEEDPDATDSSSS